MFWARAARATLAPQQLAQAAGRVDVGEGQRDPRQAAVAGEGEVPRFPAWTERVLEGEEVVVTVGRAEAIQQPRQPAPALPRLVQGGGAGHGHDAEAGLFPPLRGVGPQALGQEQLAATRGGPGALAEQVEHHGPTVRVAEPRAERLHPPFRLANENRVAVELFEGERPEAEPQLAQAPLLEPRLRHFFELLVEERLRARDAVVAAHAEPGGARVGEEGRERFGPRPRTAALAQRDHRLLRDRKELEPGLLVERQVLFGHAVDGGRPSIAPAAR